jgi:hypothetical protein
MYICFSYVPHEKSKFYELCEFDFHETIESIVLEYSDKGEVFVCGDINSRIVPSLPLTTVRPVL